MLAARSWAFSRQSLLLSFASRLGGVGGSSCSGGGGAASATTTFDSMATSPLSIEHNGAASRRSKSDLSALHRPPLVDVCIIGAVRTPIGGLLGSLSSLSATQLGGQAIAAALRAARIGPSSPSKDPSSSSSANGGGGGWKGLDVVDEVIMGNVLSAGLGQAPATQAATFAGLPPTVPAYTVNKVCASGMKAVALAASAIATGSAEVVVAGGMESMSNAPFYLRSRGARRGVKLGSLGEVEDGMLVDGLTCALSAPCGSEGEGERGGEAPSARRRRSMGSIADAAAEEAGVSREEQDWYALLSHARAKRAVEEAAEAAAAHSAEGEGEEEEEEGGEREKTISYYAWHGPEVVPVRVPTSSSSASPSSSSPFSLVSADDAPARLDETRLLKLPPAFGASGTATAGNASPVSDGAAALVLCSSSAAAMRGARVLAHVAACADAQLPPERFPFAPAEAARLALKRAGVESVAEVDLWEVNEAFASVVLATAASLGLGSRAEIERKVNVAGGAVAIGHPLGASGAAAVVRLAHAMAARNVALGVATICNGGGGATAIVLRRSVLEDGEPDDDE